MALKKYKLGELISVVDERNNIGIRNFFGINIDKEFMPTVANTEGLDETKYKVVRRNRFVYSGMQTGRDECIRVSMYNCDKPILVSPAYTTFEVTATDKVIPLYFFMKFLSKEMDRYGAFCSDGSIRSNLDWDVFCDIEIDLPSLDVQQKYVNIYNAMLKNQQAYERGLEDLKLTIDIELEKLKHISNRVHLNNIKCESDVRNKSLSVKTVSGVNKDKSFMQSVASGDDISNYKIVKENQFACNLMHIGRDVVVPISLNQNLEPILVSPAYVVFDIDKNIIMPQFLLIWLSRSETDRYAWYLCDSSVRSGMEKNRFYEIEIPIPNIEIQKSIVDIYNVYKQRKEINERMKAQIKDICPILIKGSIEDGRK